MLFTTGQFALFFALTYSVYIFLTPFHHRLQNFWLLAASYFFYAYWDYRFLLLLWLTSSFDFFMSQLIYRTQRKFLGQTLWARRWLILSLLVNFLSLFGFKYAFAIFQFLGPNILPAKPETFNFLSNMVLPLGISFYTFQSVSYVIDVYKAKIAPAKSYFDFLLYISFFPQLIAGPIERAQHFLVQIESRRTLNVVAIESGVLSILLGTFYKLFVADNLAPFCLWGAQNLKQLPGLDLWLAALAWLVRYYADFAGYSLIALGLAQMMGFTLSENFRFPLFSRSPSNFWSRWHVSLSEWFRDYLFLPTRAFLGRGIIKGYAALIFSFLIIGVWHGPKISFLVWGLNWAFAIICESLLKKFFRRYFKQKTLLVFGFFSPILTLLLIILLNSPLVILDFNEIIPSYIQFLTDWTASSDFFQNLKAVLFFISPLIILDFSLQKFGTKSFPRWSSASKTFIYLFLLFVILGGSSANTKEFIYFQF